MEGILTMKHHGGSFAIESADGKGRNIYGFWPLKIVKLRGLSKLLTGGMIWGETKYVASPDC